jgi:thiol-disulfide isomerase/thioredoxin
VRQPETAALVIQDNVFDLTCKKKSGDIFSLTFELREAIKPLESTCKSTRGEEECKLPKLHPHFFDRLTRDADLLKQNLKPDWSKWKDEDESQLQQDDNYDGESDVKSFTAKQVDEEVQKGAVVIADIYFPWCTHCSYARKAFVSAAKALSSEKHLFARIDAREDYDSSTRSDSCTHVLLFLCIESSVTERCDLTQIQCYLRL